MKHLAFILAVCFSPVLLAETGGWVTKDGTAVENSDTMKSVSGFGGWLIITPDVDWEKKWNTSPETTPRFTEAKEVSYGEPLTVLPFYINPKTDTSGEVNILCDIKVTGPDGSHSVNENGILCANGKLHGNPQNVRLASTIIKYVAEDNDLPGTWTVDVNITDKIRNIKIPLKAQFNLIAGKPQTGTNSKLNKPISKITTLDDFSYFTQAYYLNPQTELIDSAIAFLGSSELVSNPNAQATLLMSFSCLFAQYDSEQKKKWSNIINKLQESAKSLLNHSLNQQPADFLDQATLSPIKNDMNWACFFATGDISYIKNIIDTLKYMNEREDINLFLTAASAKWSLSSNARHHSIVRKAIVDLHPTPDNIIGKAPRQIRQEMISILKAQKSKGIWK